MINRLLKYVYYFLFLGCSTTLQASYYIAQKEFIQPKYDKTFAYLEYLNPNAPQGGIIRMKAPNRTFTTFYPYAFKRAAAESTQLLYASLCKSPADELTVAYGYAAEDIHLEASKGLVTFTLRPNLTFENGAPITSQDVVYSLEFAVNYGASHFQEALKGVSCKALNARKVQIQLKPFSQELAFLISKIPIIPYGSQKGETPLSSGPYRVHSYKFGYRVVYEKVPNWWGADLSINKGLYNFERIEYLYFANFNGGFEAFKKHLYDVRIEPKILVWNRQYHFTNVKEGKVIRKQIPKPVTHNLSILVFNTKQAVLKDRRVRKALSLFFDFERLNRLFFGEYYYRQQTSVFTNSGFAAPPRISPEEQKVLEPFKDQLPAFLWTEDLQLIKHDSWQKTRALWQEAYQLLQDAGWILDNGILKHKETGEVFHLELVLSVPEFAKYLQNYVQTLRTFGIRVHILLLDSTQYTNRIRNANYDIIVEQTVTPPIPGYEQKALWGRFQDPVVNTLTDRLTAAKTLKDVKLYAAALDRVLQSQYYFIFGWTMDDIRIAYYKTVAHPDTPMGLFDPFSWWATKVERSVK